MAALAFIAAALVCIIAAFVFRVARTEQELADDERLRAFIWLPTPILMIVASFYVVKRFDGSLPKLSAFSILILASLVFAALALVVTVGFGTTTPHK
jgi:hypothetical protein